jgi:RNA polymerase sigma factor (sigma-70 family)
MMSFPIERALDRRPSDEPDACDPWLRTSATGTLRPVGSGVGSGVRAVGGEGPRRVVVAADRVLAARLVAGESDALAEAYRLYAGLVFGVCQRVLRDDALSEDVTQEVFVFLWQFPERFDPARGSLRAWLGVLAHHRSVDRVRSEKRRTERQLESHASTSPPNDEAYDVSARWLSDRVRDALGQLPLEQREAVVLAYYGDRSYRQVALELGVPEGTVKSRVRLALRRLDALLSSVLSEQDAPAWI